MAINKITRILSYAGVYQLYQWIVGAGNYTQLFAESYIRYQPNNKVLDVGCGPADILKYLHKEVNYTGIDLNKHYIEKARSKYPQHKFIVGDLESPDFPIEDASFDTIFMVGVQHHLDDEILKILTRQINEKLKKGGRFLYLEPVRTSHQGKVERWFMNNDRGKYIRSAEHYQSITKLLFPNNRQEIIQGTMNIPFTIIISESIK